MTTTDGSGKAPGPDTSASGKVSRKAGEQQSLIEDVGRSVIFGASAVRVLPEALKYVSEILRQAGIIIISSSGIIWTLMMLLGAEGSLEGHYLLRQLGAADYAAIFTSTGEYSAHPSLFGWSLAAKVGCGLVAELGSMRISEEIDALEVMGIGSMAYLVATRIVAILLVMPFLIFVGFGLTFLTSHVLSIYFFHSVSAGGYETVFWTFMKPADLLGACACSMLMGVCIIIVGSYFGYTASGGPVGVGRNTAKSMVVNLVIVAVIGVISQQLFFHGLVRAPIGH